MKAELKAICFYQPTLNTYIRVKKDKSSDYIVIWKSEWLYTYKLRV